MGSTSYSREVARVLLATFVLNLVVCVAKLVYGFMTKSLSLEADGFHSLMDSSSNLIGLTGIFLAAKPPDEEHPYGHRKIEALAAMGISLLLFFTCYEIVTGVIDRTKNPVIPAVDAVSFIIMGVTMGVNYFVSAYEKKKGNLLKSDILLADAVHTRSDIFVSLSVIFSFVAVMLSVPVLDVVIASGIVLFIIYIAFRVLSRSVAVLLDAQLMSPADIEEIIAGFPNIVRCHKIRSRGTQNGVFIDLHIHVDPQMTTEESHALTHKVIKAIKERHPHIIDVLIHTEPAYSTKPREDLHV